MNFFKLQDSSIRLGVLLLLIGFGWSAVQAQTNPPARKKNAPNAETPVTVEEAEKLEAVVKTDQGVIRFEFYPDKAPQHVISFIKRARGGFYDGTTIFRAIARGIVQGGDPLLKDSLPRNRWGTGGLNLLKDEFSDLKHLRGTVSTPRIPDKPNSGGAQFFFCASAQPQLDGKFTAFGMVTEGLDVVEKISLMDTDENKFLQKPVKILGVTLEPKKFEPYKDATVAEMRKEVIIRTSLGDLTIALDPDLAPEHVRNFLKLVETGWLDHTAFHRVRPGFVVQGGLGSTREPAPYHPADRWVRNLKGEFSKDRKHIRGVLSMARTDDPDSANTSFFIVLRDAPNLDGKYSIFGKVVDGFDTLDRMEQVEVTGETPVKRLELIEAVIKP